MPAKQRAHNKKAHSTGWTLRIHPEGPAHRGPGKGMLKAKGGQEDRQTETRQGEGGSRQRRAERTGAQWTRQGAPCRCILQSAAPACLTSNRALPCLALPPLATCAGSPRRHRGQHVEASRAASGSAGCCPGASPG